MAPRGARRGGLAVPGTVPRTPVLLVAIAVTMLISACTVSSPTPHPAGTSHPASPRASAATAGNTSTAGSAEVVPATYQQACAENCVQSASSPPPAGPIPAALNRPLHFPALRTDQRCPASPGRPVSTTDFGGIALGNGPVRVVVADAGDLRHGVAVLINPTSAPPWLGLKTLWFSMPAYQGPFVIRAKRLGAPGPVALGGQPATAPLVVPPGPTLNGTGGWREAPGALWVKTPGCYAWQVDGLTFSELIIVQAVLH
jgi:hypothetical protein